MKINTNIAYIFMIIVAIVWGISWPIGRIVATSDFGKYPFTISFLRYLFALPLLFVLTKYLEKDISIPRHLVKKIFVLGLLQITLYQLFFLLGVRYTSSSDAVLIIGGGITVITAFVSSKLYADQELDRYRVVGVFMAFFGVFLIFLFSANDDNTENRILGNFLIILAAIVFAFYTSYSRPIYDEMKPLNFQFWATLFGWSILSIFSVFEQIYVGSFVLKTLETDIFFWILYLGAISAAIGNSMFSVGVKYIGPTRSSLFINLMPIAGISFAYLYLNEKVSLIYPIAFIIIFVGIYVEKLSSK